MRSSLSSRCRNQFLFSSVSWYQSRILHARARTSYVFHGTGSTFWRSCGRILSLSQASVLRLAMPILQGHQFASCSRVTGGSCQCYWPQSSVQLLPKYHWKRTLAARPEVRQLRVASQIFERPKVLPAVWVLPGLSESIPCLYASFVSSERLLFVFGTYSTSTCRDAISWWTTWRPYT